MTIEQEDAINNFHKYIIQEQNKNRGLIDIMNDDKYIELENKINESIPKHLRCYK